MRTVVVPVVWRTLAVIACVKGGPTSCHFHEVWPEWGRGADAFRNIYELPRPSMS